MDSATILSKNCVCCNKHMKIIIPKGHDHDYIDWKEGKLIQDAMPYLTPEEREMLISGICGECFNYLFGEEDEAED